jgi:hypothetical protein
MVDHPGHPDRLGVPCSYHGIEHGCCLGLDARVARRRSALRSTAFTSYRGCGCRCSPIGFTKLRPASGCGGSAELCALSCPGRDAAFVRTVIYLRMADN